MADKSEIIRNYIRELFNQGFDFANKEQRAAKFKEYCASQEGITNELNYTKHRTLFVETLKDVCDEKKIDPTLYGLARRQTTFVNKSANVHFDVSAKPKMIAAQPQLPTATNPVAIPQPQIQQQPTQQQIDITLDQVKIGCQVFINAIARKFGWELCTEAEAKAMGEAWLHLAKEYLNNNWGKFGMPVFVTAGIILSKHNSANKDKKPDEKKTTDDVAPKVDEDYHAWAKRNGIEK